MRAELAHKVSFGDILSRGRGREDGHTHLLRQIADGDHDRAVDLADNGAYLFLIHQPPIGGDALFGRSRIIFDDELDFTFAQDSALGVDVVGPHLGPALNELAEQRRTRRRQGGQDADFDRFGVRGARR